MVQTAWGTSLLSNKALYSDTALHSGKTLSHLCHFFWFALKPWITWLAFLCLHFSSMAKKKKKKSHTQWIYTIIFSSRCYKSYYGAIPQNIVRSQSEYKRSAMIFKVFKAYLLWSPWEKLPQEISTVLICMPSYCCWRGGRMWEVRALQSCWEDSGRWAYSGASLIPIPADCHLSIFPGRFHSLPLCTWVSLPRLRRHFFRAEVMGGPVVKGVDSNHSPTVDAGKPTHFSDSKLLHVSNGKDHTYLPEEE